VLTGNSAGKMLPPHQSSGRIAQAEHFGGPPQAELDMHILVCPAAVTLLGML
jgi:hypothetical protein